MKRLILIVVLIALVLTGCSDKPSDERCDAAKLQYTAVPDDEALDFIDYEAYMEPFTRPLTATEVTMLLNTEHAPDSLGAILKLCIETGWTGWRESSQMNQP